MPTMITVKFKSGYSETRLWTVNDEVCSERNPIFSGTLNESEETNFLQVCATTGGGSSGRVSYERSDGPKNLADISDGDTVTMD